MVRTHQAPTVKPRMSIAIIKMVQRNTSMLGNLDYAQEEASTRAKGVKSSAAV